MLLPRLGGSPAVWNTSLVFYQAVLLGGYLVAHVLTDRLPHGGHRVVQLTLVAAAVPLLPIAIPSGWVPPVDGSPALWTLAVLVGMVGLPFLALSTLSPTLQAWFARSGHPAGSDPYFLYAAGNAGSLLGLLTYPLVVEPAMALDTQSAVWTLGYALLIALVGGAAWLSRDRGAEALGARLPRSPAVGWGRRLTWAYLAFVPSVLLLGVTRHISTDVAAVPLLWVLPLVLYLVSFVVTFGSRDNSQLVRVSAIGVVVVSALALDRTWNAPLLLRMSVPLLLLAAAATVAHGRAHMLRPPADRLTEFYVWISAGGVAGGLFAALLVPMVADDVVEYPLAIALSVALTPRLIGSFGTRAVMRRLLQGLVALLAVGALVPTLTLVVGEDRFIFRERTFFGVHRVQGESDSEHALINGTTIHGWQDLSLQPPVPAAYYTAESPIGQAIRHVQARDEEVGFGIVGLGTGALAAYARPADRSTFYEIDPVVVDIARDPSLFTYLTEVHGTLDVVIGDGRIQLDRSQNRYTLIVLDAFTSDSIPTHLLTVEALEIYLRHLDEGGLLAFHISNRYLDLEAVLGRAARELGLFGLARAHDPPEGERGALPSRWVVLARDEQLLGGLAASGGDWRSVRTDGPLWTDHHSPLLPVLNLW